MGPLGVQEMVVIAVVALLVLGPERLPEAARRTARFLSRFRAEAGKAIDELKQAADVADLEREVRALRGELSGVRDDVRGTFRGVLDDGGGRPGARTPVRTQPPPFDPDTT